MSRRIITTLMAGACLAAGLGLAAVGPAWAADEPAIPPTTPAAPDAPALPPKDPREPSRVQVSWELTFKHGPLERLIMTVDGKEQTFWYMRYTVVNNSGRDVLFIPDFEIITDSGVVIDSYKKAPAGVFDKIKALYKNPLVLSPINIDGKLLQGEDNAKDSVAIFPALDAESRNFRVMVMGLSGETSEVSNPKTKDAVLLHKTLELDYNIPGQAVGIEPQVKLTATKWVMK